MAHADSRQDHHDHHSVSCHFELTTKSIEFEGATYHVAEGIDADGQHLANRDPLTQPGER